jgi:DNA replication protein DnaC
MEAARARLNEQYAGAYTTALAPRPVNPGDNCRQCGGAGMLRANPEARPDEPGFGKPVACPDPCHNDDRLKQLAILSNMNKGELSVSLNDLEERHDILDYIELDYNRDENGNPVKMQRSNREMLRVARKIIANPYDFGIVYFLGPNGNGKTTAGQAICNGINEAGKGPAMYINLVELIGFVVASYDPANEGPTTDQRYKMIATAPILVVDEFDFGDAKNRATEHTLHLLHKWFNDRYRLAKNKTGLTVLIGNEPIQGLGLPAINSRLGEGWFTRIINTAPDERPDIKRREAAL